MDMRMTRRAFVLGTLSTSISSATARAQKQATPPRYSSSITSYLKRLYAEERREFTYRDDYPGGLQQWQKDARPALRKLIGLPRISAQCTDHEPIIQVREQREFDHYTRYKAWIETESDVRIPFWLLRPKGPGPFPLAVLPHGHDRIGHDTYAGVYHDETHRQKTLAQERNVAVQAVERGFLAIAPATRGLAVAGVPDVFARHDKRDCRSQLMHCLLASRTAIGERVWDLSRILDWAVMRPDFNKQDILMMGNSGGGMATLYASACDERITVAIPSCSFTTIASREGRIYHCDCNMVPGILEWGDLYDVAGLIAPRWLLAVNGRKDTLHDADAIERAAKRVRAVYKAVGCSNRFDHRWGPEGHRFYSGLMWPFVRQSQST